MKVLVRIMCFLLTTLIVTVSIIYLLNTNVIINELNDCSSLAMKQTQKIMKDIVISRLDRDEKNLFKDKNYEEYYIDAFTNSVENKNIYNLKTTSDYSKGILFVEISVPKYPLIPKKKLLNIVNVEGEGLDDIESLYYEEINTASKKYLDIQKWESTLAQTIYTWEFKKNTPITNSRIEIYAINGFSQSPRTKYGVSAELRCTNEDGDVSVLKKAGAGKLKSTTLNGKLNASCKYVDLVVTEDVPEGTYSDKTDTIIVPKTSYIEVQEIGKREKENYKLSEHVKVNTRYINDINKLNSSSIWLQNKEYEDVLKEFINKL